MVPPAAARAVLPFLLVLLVFAGRTGAEDAVPRGPGPESITLAEVRLRALAQAAGARLARIAPRAARAAWHAARAVYDPRFAISGGRQEDRTDRLSPVFGTDVRTDRLGFGLDWEVPTGTSLGLHLDMDRVSTDSIFATIDPAYESRLALELAQPITGNLFGRRTRERVRARHLVWEAERVAGRERLEDALAEAEAAYWALARAGEAEALADEALDRAEALHRAMADRRERGTALDQDLLGAEAHVLRRRADLLAAEVEREAAGRALRVALGEDPGAAVVAADPLVGEGGAPVAGKEIPQAVEAAGFRHEARLAEVRVARWSRRPQLDLILSLSANGIDDDNGTTLGEVIRGENPAFFVGLRVSIPWGDRAARASLDGAQAAAEAAATTLEDTVRRSEALRADARARLDLWQRRFALAEQVVDVTQAKLEAERADFEAGRFDSDRLIRFEEEWILARLERLEVRTMLARARIEAARVQDTLLAEGEGR